MNLSSYNLFMKNTVFKPPHLEVIPQKKNGLLSSSQWEKAKFPYKNSRFFFTSHTFLKRSVSRSFTHPPAPFIRWLVLDRIGDWIGVGLDI